MYLSYLSISFRLANLSRHQWRDIGEKKAIRKTRQSLREGAPSSMAAEGNYFIHFLKTLNNNQASEKSSGNGKKEIRLKTLNNKIPSNAIQGQDMKEDITKSIKVADHSISDDISLECHDKLD